MTIMVGRLFLFVVTGGVLAPVSAFAEPLPKTAFERDVHVAYGYGSFTPPLAIRVPAPVFASVGEAPRPVRSVGMIVGGSFLTAAGVVATPIGVLLTIVSQSSADCAPGPNCDTGPSPGFTAAAIATTVLGLAAVGGGITLIVVGAQRKTAEPSVAVRMGPQSLMFEGRF